MTSAGPCNVCGKTASIFIYRSPSRLPDGRHNGEWWCDEHEPDKKPFQTGVMARPELSRSERRALARKKK